MAKPQTIQQPTPRNIQNGFNAGYLLAKRPDILNKLLPALEPSNEYLKGILLGKEQYDKEQKQKSQPKEQAPHDRERDLGKEELDRDR